MEVLLLVLACVHVVKTVARVLRAHNLYHGLAAFHHRIKVNLACLRIYHVIVFVQLRHRLHKLLVHDVVVHCFIVCQRSRVCAYAVYVNVSAVRHECQSLRLCLHEVVVLLIAHSRAAVTVHIQFHQSAVSLLAHGKRHLYALALCVFRFHAHRHFRHYWFPRIRIYVRPVLAVYRRSALQRRALCGHSDAFHVILHAVHHHAVPVRHVLHHQLHFNRAATRLHVLQEWAVVHGCPRAVLQHQCVAVPAARRPVHAIESRAIAVVLPYLARLRALRVAPAARRQLHLQALRSLANVQTARLHFHVEGCSRLAARQSYGYCALLHVSP